MRPLCRLSLEGPAFFLLFLQFILLTVATDFLHKSPPGGPLLTVFKGLLLRIKVLPLLFPCPIRCLPYRNPVVQRSLKLMCSLLPSLTARPVWLITCSLSLCNWPIPSHSGFSSCIILPDAAVSTFLNNVRLRYAS